MSLALQITIQHGWKRPLTIHNSPIFPSSPRSILTPSTTTAVSSALVSPAENRKITCPANAKKAYYRFHLQTLLTPQIITNARFSQRQPSRAT